MGHQELQNIQAIADGDRQAFLQLYQEYADLVYNLALSYVKHIPDAEEITQDVFTKIHRKAGQFKGGSSLKTWIYRITINTSLTYLKKRKRQSIFQFGSTDQQVPDFEHPGVLLENKEKAKLLFQTIETLPDQQKTAFLLSFVEELPRQQVADIMEVSLKSVEALLQRAKKKMRLKLEKHYPNRRKSKSKASKK
ncbi:MAG: RNA polymerase sigma factor [Bacteroidota bacterium]